MRFWVELEPSKYKVGDAAHYINVERRLQQQIPFLRELRAAGTIEAGPFSILNREAACISFIANVESWEELSTHLHRDPMSIYTGPKVAYLADWEESMVKHFETRANDDATRSLEQDVRIDRGLNLPRGRDSLESVIRDQATQIELLREEVGQLIREIASLRPDSHDD